MDRYLNYVLMVKFSASINLIFQQVSIIKRHLTELIENESRLLFQKTNAKKKTNLIVIIFIATTSSEASYVP